MADIERIGRIVLLRASSVVLFSCVLVFCSACVLPAWECLWFMQSFNNVLTVWSLHILMLTYFLVPWLIKIYLFFSGKEQNNCSGKAYLGNGRERVCTALAEGLNLIYEAPCWVPHNLLHCSCMWPDCPSSDRQALRQLSSIEAQQPS